MNHSIHWLAVGRIMGAFGVRGELRIQSFTEETQRLLEFPHWRIGQQGDQGSDMHLVSGRVHGAGLVVRLQEITSREQAQALLHQSIWIDRQWLPELEDGWFYWSELIGCQVWTTEELLLGTVIDVFATGANDVLVVQDTEGEERLLPFTEEVVHIVDPTARTLRVQLLAGM